MQAPTADMLKRLGSGVVPGPIGQNLSPATGKTPAEGLSFDQLLKSARGPQFRSEPVKIARGSKVELDASQLRRLGPAVDSAEANGASRLLAMIDGQAVVIDVASRSVEAKIDPSDAVVHGVDAFAVVPPAPATPDAPPSDAEKNQTQPPIALPLPGAESVRNVGLASLLASIKGAA